MRTKALLLGAGPLPVEGPWVSIEEGGRWSCRVEENPEGADVNGLLKLEVASASGEIAVHSPTDTFEGREARAILSEPVKTILSVFLESDQ